MALNAIARELAFVQASAPHAFDLVPVHIAGARNAWCDALSRLSEPGSGATVPARLLPLPRSPAGSRHPSEWATLGSAEGAAAALGVEVVEGKGVPVGGGVSGDE